MKIRFILIFLTLIYVFSVFFSCAGNGEKSGDTKAKLIDNTDSISYSIGADIGDNIINQGIDIDYDAFTDYLKTQQKANRLYFKKAISDIL